MSGETTDKPQGCVRFDGGYMCFGRHAEGSARGRDGRVWRWEFDQRFGPTFVGKDGAPLKVQPDPREPPRKQHPAWEEFERWLATRTHEPTTPTATTIWLDVEDNHG